jgi:CheY-like chemotaxis protein
MSGLTTIVSKVHLGWTFDVYCIKVHVSEGQWFMAQRPEAVLIVDDDDLYVRALTRQLRDLGFPYVYRASSGQQAIEMLSRVRPTIVLTDMAMEHNDAGREVIATAERQGAAVAVVSGSAALHAEELGVPLQRKSELQGDALAHLVLELVESARRRSRASLRPAARVA